MGGLIITLALIGGLSMACGLARVHTYLIPAKMEPRWITIEYDNPKCAALKESVFGREFAIPESGFLCTSSPMYMGWHRTKFYLVDELHNRTAIQAGERIFRQESLAERKWSSDAGTFACKVTGEEFFYGPKEKVTSENPIMEDEIFLRYHPECRNRAVPVKPIL